MQKWLISGCIIHPKCTVTEKGYSLDYQCLQPKCNPFTLFISGLNTDPSTPSELTSWPINLTNLLRANTQYETDTVMIEFIYS